MPGFAYIRCFLLKKALLKVLLNYLLGPPKGCCFVGFMYQKTIKNPQNKTLWVALVFLIIYFCHFFPRLLVGFPIEKD